MTGGLRIPKQLENSIAGKEDSVRERILEVLQTEGWADLGFLILALRKLSTRISKQGRGHAFGDPVELFSARPRADF